jgi:hypothetical protein
MAAATSLARSVPLKASGLTRTGGSGVAGKGDGRIYEFGGIEVGLSNPGAVYFPRPFYQTCARTRRRADVRGERSGSGSP